MRSVAHQQSVIWQHRCGNLVIRLRCIVMWLSCHVLRCYHLILSRIYGCSVHVCPDVIVQAFIHLSFKCTCDLKIAVANRSNNFPELRLSPEDTPQPGQLADDLNLNPEITTHSAFADIITANSPPPPIFYAIADREKDTILAHSKLPHQPLW